MLLSTLHVFRSLTALTALVVAVTTARAELISLSDLEGNPDSPRAQEIWRFLEGLDHTGRGSSGTAATVAVEDEDKENTGLDRESERAAKPATPDETGDEHEGLHPADEPTLFTTHTCVGAGNCLIENLCHGTDGRFVYVKSPAAIFDRPAQIHYDTRYSGERHYKVTNSSEGQTTFDLRTPAGMTSTGYKHFLNSRIFEDIPPAAISSRLYHATLHPKLRDMRVVEAIDVASGRGGSYVLDQVPRGSFLENDVEIVEDGNVHQGQRVIVNARNGLPYPFWPPEGANPGPSGYDQGEHIVHVNFDHPASTLSAAAAVEGKARASAVDLETRTTTRQRRKRLNLLVSDRNRHKMGRVVRAIDSEDDIEEDAEAVQLIMGRLWPTDAGHTMMDNMGPLYRALKQWGVLDVPGEAISPFEVNPATGVDSIGSGDTTLPVLVEADDATPEEGVHDQLYSDVLPCGPREAQLVKTALNLKEDPPLAKKDNCPVLANAADLPVLADFLRTDPKRSENRSRPLLIQVHVPNDDFGGRMPPSMRKYEGMFYFKGGDESDHNAGPAVQSTGTGLKTSSADAEAEANAYRDSIATSTEARNAPKKTAGKRLRTLRLFSSPDFSFLDAQVLASRAKIVDGQTSAGRDMRYGGCRDECEGRLIQAFVDGERERLLRLDQDLPRGKCFRKVIAGWRGMQFFNVFDWLARNSAPWRHDVSLGTSPEYLLGLRNYIFEKHGLLSDKYFMGLVERRKVVRVPGGTSNKAKQAPATSAPSTAPPASETSSRSRRVDRVRPSILLLVKKVGAGSGYNCCHWENSEQLKSRLLTAFDHKVDIKTLSWAGIPIYRQLWIMAETDITISFAGADVMNFLFSPLYSGLISPYRLRNNKWERSYEIDRLWVNLPNRYLQQFGVNAVDRVGVSTGMDAVTMAPGKNQALLLAPWRQEKPRGLVRQRIPANLTEGTINTEKANWPAMVFSDLLMKEVELYVAEALEYMTDRGVEFAEFPEL